ncbi:hypothetical protein INS49_000423 [Diaporthe citri]|uniref:uncharacterized protein n=1 Tax=Diaporthe citri TaxID=83186 RepID=UPI001C818457|nr:uncharacterized protein INS49_000423 [Diaporthe citri]KAG6366247.1 hypothetical protein INS49_000423 [Diaporthe citri]
MAPSAMVQDEMEPLQLPYARASKISASTGPLTSRLGELQVALRSTGICGSDVSYYKKFANGDLCACQPLSLGHESSGVVVAIGPQGRYNLCKKMRFRSSAKSFPHFQGTLQDKINHPAVWCHKLPDNVSFDAAALLEPLSVAIHARNRARPEAGSTALVLGAGTVGLLTAAMARQSGCTTVTVCDVDQGRVDYALDKGFATHGYVVPRPLHLSSSSSSVSGASTPGGVADGAMTPASSVFSTLDGRLEGAKATAADIIAASFRAASSAPLADTDEDEDDGFDVTFECTGKEVCMHTSLYATRPGGKVIMVGMGTPIQTLPMSVAHLREVDILGIFRYANTYATGIRLLCAQKRGGGAFALPSLDNMVTHRFKGLENARQAFELAGRTVDDEGRMVLKVVIEA